MPCYSTLPCLLTLPPNTIVVSKYQRIFIVAKSQLQPTSSRSSCLFLTLKAQTRKNAPSLGSRTSTYTSVLLSNTQLLTFCLPSFGLWAPWGWGLCKIHLCISGASNCAWHIGDGRVNVYGMTEYQAQATPPFCRFLVLPFSHPSPTKIQFSVSWSPLDFVHRTNMD